MATLNTGIFRDVVTPDPREMPQTVARDVISSTVQNSALLQVARRQLMPARTHRMPVLNALPGSYWVDGSTFSGGHTANDTTDGYDLSAKQTTGYSWSNVTLTAIERAVLIPVQDSYVADTGVDLLAEVRPYVAQAFGQAIDSAGLFGIGWPGAWGASTQNIYTSAIAAGNFLKTGGTLASDTAVGADIAVDLGGLAQKLAQQGFDANGWLCEPGFPWRLTALRTSAGIPIYSPPAPSQPETIFGHQLVQVRNGSWAYNTALLPAAHVITGDWRYAIVGVRQDLTFDVSNSAVIANPSNGQVTYSAFQQDGKVLRAVMRVAFATAAPVTPLKQSGQYPFAVYQIANSPAS